jgi:hypothetical protein
MGCKEQVTKSGARNLARDARERVMSARAKFSLGLLNYFRGVEGHRGSREILQDLGFWLMIVLGDLLWRHPDVAIRGLI